ALPFDVIQWEEGAWHESRVGVSSDRFQWVIHEDWAGNPPLIEGGVPSGYRTEIRTGLKDFLAPLAVLLEKGLLLWIDYGFARPEYFASERTTGTLRTFSNHRAGEDPFETPGEIDITAHVDFTAVAEAGMSLGAIPSEFTNQGSWLTKLASTWLASQEGNPDP